MAMTQYFFLSLKDNDYKASHAILYITDFFSFCQYNNHWAIAKLAPQTHPKPPNISSSQLSNIHHKVVQKIHLPSVI